MIQDDITLARYLYDLAADHPELEAITNHLSITTLRYVLKNFVPVWVLNRRRTT